MINVEVLLVKFEGEIVFVFDDIDGEDEIKVIDLGILN